MTDAKTMEKKMNKKRKCEVASRDIPANKRSARLAGDAYWTLLPEMRGEISKHLVTAERFRLLMTHKASYTEDAQRAVLVDGLWDDFVKSIYAADQSPQLPVPHKEHSSRYMADAFFSLNRDIRDYLATATDVVMDKGADNSLFKEKNFKRFLMTLNLGQLKQHYRNFITDMSSAFAQLIGDWLYALVGHNGGDSLIDAYNAQKADVSLHVYLSDRDQRTLYQFAFTVMTAHGKVGGNAQTIQIPVVYIVPSYGINRPHRHVTRRERDRVAECQTILNRIAFTPDTIRIGEGLMAMIRTLLLEVDPGIELQFDYDVWTETKIDAWGLDYILRPFDETEDCCYVSRATQMNLHSHYLKPAPPVKQ